MAELAAAAQRAQTFAGGSGAALLSAEDGELLCRAISGSSPPVGTRFPLTASFPGLCVKERKPLKCDEADTDARVEKGAYVALKIKSIVVVPVMEQQSAAGVLAVFSSSACAFHNTHIAILRTMADSTLSALQTVRQEAAAKGASGTDSTIAEAPTQQAAPVIPEFAVTPGVGAQPRDAVAPSPVMPKVAMPAPSRRPASTAPPMPLRPPVTPPAPLMQPVGEPVSPTPQSLKKKEEIVSLAAEVGPRPMPRRVTPQPTPTFPIRPVTSRPAAPRARRYEPPRQQKRGFLPFAVTAMLFAAIAAGAWGLYTRRNRPATAQNQVAPPSAQQLTSAATSPRTSVNEPVVVAETQPSENSVSVRDVATAELRPTAASANLAVSKREPEYKPARLPQYTSKENAGLRNEHRPAPPTTTPAAWPTSTPAPAAAAQPATSTPAEPPVKVAWLPNTTPGPVLVNPTPAGLPTLAPAKSPQTTPAEIIKRVPPSYPPLALSAHLTGTVTVAATVSKEGRVTAVQVVSGPPLFREAATSAVKQWRFKPAMVNGVATESTANIVLKFTNSGR